MKNSDIFNEGNERFANREIGEIFGMKYLAVSKAALGMESEMKKDKGLRADMGGLFLISRADPLLPC
ncbi:MAG: hypothetical protein ABIA77_04850 [Candidatus Omnitrophota bacterium]